MEDVKNIQPELEHSSNEADTAVNNPRMKSGITSLYNKKYTL